MSIRAIVGNILIVSLCVGYIVYHLNKKESRVKEQRLEFLVKSRKCVGYEWDGQVILRYRCAIPTENTFRTPAELIKEGPMVSH